jgi:uncharacterized protein (UPF0262 family)
MSADQPSDRRRIAHIALDEKTMVRRSAEVEHERQVAIYDLLEDNSFSPQGLPDGPYNLHIAVQENRLLFDIRDTQGKKLRDVILSMTPFRTVVKDYFTICDSYYNAIKKLSPSQIEALDMGRRGLHNEGSELLRERLEGKIELDLDTARRLFTLICVLHIRG